ncbi:MAG: hypothetical protein ACRDRO_07425 [Pseudonocardiaceae bacterium]
MTQAQGTDFASYAKLSESELEALDRALASIPDDILSTGERPPIESRIRRRLQEDGVLKTGEAGGPLGVAEIPAVAFVGRAVGCLASNYSYLRGISQNKPPGEVAESIARAVADCVPGDIDAIKSDILKYRGQVARAFKALGLPALGDALCAVDSGGLYEMGSRDMRDT